MKIYFTAAIAQADKYGPTYRKIVNYLKQLGHTVISDHILKQDLRTIVGQSDEEHTAHYRKVLKWINEADAVVAEATFPSTLHVGHEITIALEKGRPTIVLFRKKTTPLFFLQGMQSDKIILVEYTEDDLFDSLKDALEYSTSQQDVRFNFFVSPEIQQYLNWVAKYRRTPRAVYLRELLEKDMRDNKDWKKQK